MHRVPRWESIEQCGVGELRRVRRGQVPSVGGRAPVLRVRERQVQRRAGRHDVPGVRCWEERERYGKYRVLRVWERQVPTRDWQQYVLALCQGHGVRGNGRICLYGLRSRTARAGDGDVGLCRLRRRQGSPIGSFFCVHGLRGRRAQ